MFRKLLSKYCLPGPRRKFLFDLTGVFSPASFLNMVKHGHKGAPFSFKGKIKKLSGFVVREEVCLEDGTIRMEWTVEDFALWPVLFGCWWPGPHYSPAHPNGHSAI